MTAYEIKRLLDLKKQNFKHPSETQIIKEFSQPWQKQRIYQKCLVGQDLIEQFPQCRNIKYVFRKKDLSESNAIEKEYKLHRRVFNDCKSDHLVYCYGYNKNTILFEWVDAIDIHMHYENIKLFDSKEQALKNYYELLKTLEDVSAFVIKLSDYYRKNNIHLGCHIDNYIFTGCKRKFVIVDLENTYNRGEVEAFKYIKQYKKIISSDIEYLKSNDNVQN